MKKYTIKTATAEYTGGGIYIYFGELTNGRWFRTETTWGCTHICESDTSTPYADEAEFYDDFTIDVLHDDDHEEFFNDMIDWINTNKPNGNYNIAELEREKYKQMETSVEIERAGTLNEQIRAEVKQAKFDLLMNQQMSAITDTMKEYRNGCSFIFSRGDYYYRDFEKQWRDEFYKNARRIFESKGYRIELRSTHEYIAW